MSNPNNRYYYVLGFMMVFFVFFLVRLYQIQILDDDFKERAERTSLKKEVVTPARGLIYDRDGRLIVKNDFQSDLYFTFNLLDTAMDVDRFCSILGISDSLYRVRIGKDWSSYKYSRNVPTVFMENIADSTLAIFKEHLFLFPGFELRTKTVRGYEYNIAPHALGYLSEVDLEKLETSEEYQRGDYHGVSGIEGYYEEELRGKKGVRVTVRDNVGRSIGSYQSGVLDKKAQQGLDIQLGIDVELQQFAQSLLENKRGSIVAIEPRTGEILAMVSAPSYDPRQLVVSRDRGQVYQQLLVDSTKPLFDRSTSAHYPPGSVFKPILALVALQEGVIDPERIIRCTGAYHYRGSSWGCHAGPGNHDLNAALRVSCNTYFYTVYRDLVDRYGFENPARGLDELSSSLAMMGLGQGLGIDLPQESSGLNPDSRFYDSRYENGSWRSTYIVSNGIGQGEVEVTTLQMANLAAIIANRGFYRIPHLAQRFFRSPKQIQEKYLEKREVEISYQHFESVVQGMERAVQFGTASSAYVPGMQVCGKTGTSQNSHGKDHSVFFGFAPRDNPQIAVAVYVENGGWGGTYAAPMGGLLMEHYIQDSVADSRQWLVSRVKK